MIIAALIIFIRRKYHRDHQYIIILLIALSSITLLVKRPNFRYVLYVYPAFLLLVLITFHRLNKLKLLVWIFLILLLPPYTYFYYSHHQYNSVEYLHKIYRAVPHDNLPVVGGASDWFVFKDRCFFTLNYNGKFRKLGLKKFYLIENPDYQHTEFPQLRDIINQYYSGKTISSLTVNQERFTVKLEQAKPKMRVKIIPSWTGRLPKRGLS
jgi:hypothetical protein